MVRSMGGTISPSRSLSSRRAPYLTFLSRLSASRARGSRAAPGRNLRKPSKLAAAASRWPGFTIRFFGDTACDASGHGEGRLILGSTTVTTNSDGFGGFDVTLPVSAPLGSIVSATATDPAGNTSEFSQCATVVLWAVEPDLLTRVEWDYRSLATRFRASEAIGSVSSGLSFRNDS